MIGNKIRKAKRQRGAKLIVADPRKIDIAKYADLLGKVGGGVAVQGSAGKCKPEELTTRMAEFMERCKPLVELAEETNSYLAIENHGNALLVSYGLGSMALAYGLPLGPVLGKHLVDPRPLLKRLALV